MPTRAGEGLPRVRRPRVRDCVHRRHAADAQRVQHHGERARRHADRSEPRRHETKRGEGYGGEVVAKRPAPVLPQDRQHVLRDRSRFSNRVEFAGDHDVARRLCHVGGRAHRHGDVGTGEHRRIVHSVADDDDACTCRAQRRKPRELVRRCLARSPGLDSERRSDRRDFDFRVTTRNSHDEAIASERVDRARAPGCSRSST